MPFAPPAPWGIGAPWHVAEDGHPKGAQESGDVPEALDLSPMILRYFQPHPQDQDQDAGFGAPPPNRQAVNCLQDVNWKAGQAAKDQAWQFGFGR